MHSQCKAVYADEAKCKQPRSQGLSSYRPLERARRDPGISWSCVSQNLGDDNEIVKGMGGLVGLLSILINRN